MPKYRVMCHPQKDGTEFYTIEWSRLGVLWSPVGPKGIGSDSVHPTRYADRWVAMEAAQKLYNGPAKDTTPYAVAYYPPAQLPPR